MFGTEIVSAKSPHVAGILPRSGYSANDECEAWRGAIEMARGRILPTFLFGQRRILGLTRGCGPFSPDVLVQRFHSRMKFRDMVQAKADMLAMSWPTKYDDIIASIGAGKFGRTYWSKPATTAGVANNWYDLWPVAGNPAAGAINGTAKTANIFTDASTGAMNHRGNVSTDTKRILSKAAVYTANTPWWMLYDRVVSYDLCPYAAAANQTMTNTNTAARYNTAAPGLLIVACVCTVNGATATNITQLRYTNQAGTTLQTMPTTPTVSIIVSGAVPTATLGARVIAPSSAATPTWGAFMPLAAGDTGCRLINDYTPSAANTGTVTFVLMHPLTDLMVPVAAVPQEMDSIFQITDLEQIIDGAALGIMQLQPATAGHTAQGAIRYAWGT